MMFFWTYRPEYCKALEMYR